MAENITDKLQEEKKELDEKIQKLGVEKTELSTLLSYGRTYLGDLTKKGVKPIPKHIIIIIDLLLELKNRSKKFDIKGYLKSKDYKQNKAKGGVSK